MLKVSVHLSIGHDRLIGGAVGSGKRKQCIQSCVVDDGMSLCGHSYTMHFRKEPKKIPVATVGSFVWSQCHKRVECGGHGDGVDSFIDVWEVIVLLLIQDLSIMFDVS